MGTFSDWTEINRGVPQGLVFRPLLFNIFINDLFFLPLHRSLVNYAADNHLCNDNDGVCVLKRHLETDSAMAVKWFIKNQTTTNVDKFQSILLSRRNVDDFNIDICAHTISRDTSSKMVGVTLDDWLNMVPSAVGPLYVTSSYSTSIFCKEVSDFATDCLCGV